MTFFGTAQAVQKYSIHKKRKTNLDKTEIEGEEGVNEYKGIFFIFAFEVYSHMDKQLIAYGNQNGLSEAISEFQPQTRIIENNVAFLESEKLSKNHLFRSYIWSLGLKLKNRFGVAIHIAISYKPLCSTPVYL